jgi:hypothetical protein
MSSPKANNSTIKDLNNSKADKVSYNEIKRTMIMKLMRISIST